MGKLIDTDVLMVALTQAGVLPGLIEVVEKAAGELPAAEAARTPVPLNAAQAEAATHVNPTLIGEYEEALKDVPTAGAVIEPPTAGAFLRKAAAIVDGNREATHGDRERSFDAIAREWQAYLELRKGGPLVGRDVALMMVKLKMVRAILGDATFEDHYVDMAGYAALAGEV